MQPRPLLAVFSTLVTGESLERLRRGLAAGTSNPDPPTGSTDQLLPTGGGRAWEVLDLKDADTDLFRGGCGGRPTLDSGGQLKNNQI
jgi:heparin-binding EGF-like growth factor